MHATHAVLDQLRAETGAAHQALDAALNLVDRLAEPGGAAAMLPRYHALHATVEAAALPHLHGVPGLALPARSRAAQIAAALREAGLDPLPPPPPLPVHTQAAALGALYVIEGATLGGRMILRALAARGADTTNLGFLSPYGAETGGMWRDLVTVIERDLAAHPAARQQACAAASATFVLARACLCEPIPRRMAA